MHGRREPREYLLSHIQEALATDERVTQLDIDVRLTETEVVLNGTVPTKERKQVIEEVVRSVVGRKSITNDLEIRDLSGQPAEDTSSHAVRVAAVGDIHYGEDSSGELLGHLEHIADEADLLLLSGDLTRHGTVEEAEVLAVDLASCAVPVIAVLGNHDYHHDQDVLISQTLQSADVAVLDDVLTILDVRGVSVGVAGSKGFGGGFAGACGSEFGEPIMKAFIGHTRLLAERLQANLRLLDTDIRIALLHFSPTEDTLRGERLEIYPFLGSYLLAEAIDSAGCDVAFHGHAHLGSETGLTPGGIPVRNVAQPVIKRPYKVYAIEPSGELAGITAIGVSAS